ncbi:hypothetical protein GT003_15310 [Paenibacillus sacheonensis]|uniref:MaoC-like domain-containing protein n=2 Tax=Paenibacillus sacheonensis TaxID=742054 RepID=A0A7X5BXD6_9BACL|nr:hypothetical protein [Paenibacillus sacheonensis]
MNKTITMEAIRHYAAASNDTAAIHHDPEAAKRAGFERPIAHGMYIMGIAHAMYMRKHPARWIRSTQMTFLSPLLSDTSVRLEFECSQEEVRVTVIGENGEVIAKGSFLVGRRSGS